MNVFKEFQNILLSSALLADKENKRVLDDMIETLKRPEAIEILDKDKAVQDLVRGTLVMATIAGEGAASALLRRESSLLTRKGSKRAAGGPNRREDKKLLTCRVDMCIIPV